MQYRFTLKDNNQKAYRLFVWFLLFFHIVAAGIIGLNAVSRDTKTEVYIFYGICAIVSTVYYFNRKGKTALDTYSFIMAILYVIFWLRHIGVFAMFFLLPVFLFVFMVQRKKTMVLFSVEGVHLKRIFKTIIYPWGKLDNVILKDNLLTIDFKSNKLMQAEIAEESEQADEKIFNRYCAAQLQNNA